MRPWVAFFSQTGTEIYNLSNALGIYPDIIVTNKNDIDSINKELLSLIKFREYKLNKTILEFIPSKPVASNYLKVLKGVSNPIVTLHGFLKIIPKEICDNYEIYNLHPGLIDKYPELKGFNPQERAYKGGYKLAGCVIHKVVPEVDEGDIIMGQGATIENKTLEEVYSTLHQTAFDLWKSFFTAYNILEK